MKMTEKEWSFTIGGREIYFYRDEASERNYFGLKVGNTYVEPNFAKDVLFGKPEQYLASVFAFLEDQEKVLKEENSRRIGATEKKLADKFGGEWVRRVEYKDWVCEEIPLRITDYQIYKGEIEL